MAERNRTFDWISDRQLAICRGSGNAISRNLHSTDSAAIQKTSPVLSRRLEPERDRRPFSFDRPLHAMIGQLRAKQGELLVSWTIVGLELAALLAIAVGLVWSWAKLAISQTRGQEDDPYVSLRRGFGRGTLVALKLLIVAGIVRSLVLEPSPSNIAVLGALVAIRTFLTFSIDVELDGCWPWLRARMRSSPEGRVQ